MADINRISQDAANSGLLDKEKYVVPPHLHDLQESDLPETQRGLVISEIAQFRERAAKREREKMRDVRESIPHMLNVPSGPKAREWGKPQTPAPPASKSGPQKGAGGFNKTPGFVKAEESAREEAVKNKSDEELEAERKEARRRDEEISFRDVSTFVEPSGRLLIYLSENGDMSPANEPAYKHSSERLRVRGTQLKRRNVMLLR